MTWVQKVREKKVVEPEASDAYLVRVGSHRYVEGSC